MSQATHIPTYKAVHRSVRQARGPASAHKCTLCSAKALHWAYDHRDPDERTDMRGCPYSLNIEHYWPMCVSCHRQLDRSHARRLAGEGWEAEKCDPADAIVGTVPQSPPSWFDQGRGRRQIA